MKLTKKILKEMVKEALNEGKYDDMKLNIVVDVSRIMNHVQRHGALSTSGDYRVEVQYNVITKFIGNSEKSKGGKRVRYKKSFKDDSGRVNLKNAIVYMGVKEGDLGQFASMLLRHVNLSDIYVDVAAGPGMSPAPLLKHKKQYGTMGIKNEEGAELQNNGSFLGDAPAPAKTGPAGPDIGTPTLTAEPPVKGKKKYDYGMSEEECIENGYYWWGGGYGCRPREYQGGSSSRGSSSSKERTAYYQNLGQFQDRGNLSQRSQRNMSRPGPASSYARTGFEESVKLSSDELRQIVQEELEAVLKEKKK